MIEAAVSHEAGAAHISDTRTPIKPVKVPDTDEYSDMTTTYIGRDGPKVSTELPEPEPRKSLEQAPDTSAADKRTELSLLIAEDDPINMTILRKRLERTGHKVFHAVNGEECAALYGEKSDSFDVVLMDMQVS